MLQMIGKEYFRVRDELLVETTLASGKIDKILLEAIQRLKRDLTDYPSSVAFDRKRIKMLCQAADLRITRAALSCGLYFRESKQLAVISGAGVAGLAASFELRARGFNVVIVEKRKDFSRFNVINLNVETQAFLKRFNLLKTFERFIAAAITEHRYVVVGKMKTARRYAVSDVRELQLDESVSFEPKNFKKLFDQDGIYSVPIGVLQTFLAENALKAGVNIFGDVTVKVLARTRAGGVSKVQIVEGQILQPNLFFIAEGAHSTTASQLGMKRKRVKNVCTGENWIFGNMTYPGRETFVVSLIDTSEKTLRIANVIFNAKSQVINVAVTSDEKVNEDSIRKQILQTVHQVFDQKAFPLGKIESTLLTTVHKPVHVINRISSPFSVGNIFCIGDSAGTSSPLAGLGGTLGLTLIPSTIRQLLNDYQQQSKFIHQNFHESSEAYTTRWIQKSENIKKLCLSLFDEEQSAN